MEKEQYKENNVTHRTGCIQLKMYESAIGVYYHWPDEYEFLCMESGACVCMIDGQYVEVSEGEAVLIRPGELHTFLDNSNRAKFFLAVFHPYLVMGTDCAGLFSNAENFARKYSDQTPGGCKIIRLLRQLYRCYQAREEGFELEAKGQLIRIFGVIIGSRLYENQPKIRSTFAKFKPLLEYVHQHYNEKITLERLAEAGHYSQSYILSLFKQNTGLTPVNYINSYRIYKAVELLRGTESRIIDVAMETGFPNVAYFIRQFRRSMNMTPLEYRKRSRKKD